MDWIAVTLGAAVWIGGAFIAWALVRGGSLKGRDE